MKGYPEYDYEQMKRDLENFIKDYGDNDWNEDDENQIKIKYYNQSEFEESENLILWKPYKMIKKRNTFKLLHEDCFCDYFCKMIISYYANMDKIMTPKNLHSSGVAERNLIVSGRYTEWKGYFVDSDLAERFGVKALKYEKPDLESLLIKLLDEASGNLALAEKGIIVIDEFDKLGTSNKDDELAMRKGI